MTENWDLFETNLCETAGSIEKFAFTFNFKSFEVWQGGKCIDKDSIAGEIKSILKEGILTVSIDSPKINKHIISRFQFSEISTVNERIMWSKDLFNKTGISEFNNPVISSLFF